MRGRARTGHQRSPCGCSSRTAVTAASTPGTTSSGDTSEAARHSSATSARRDDQRDPSPAPAVRRQHGKGAGEQRPDQADDAGGPGGRLERRVGDALVGQEGFCRCISANSASASAASTATSRIAISAVSAQHTQVTTHATTRGAGAAAAAAPVRGQSTAGRPAYGVQGGGACVRVGPAGGCGGGRRARSPRVRSALGPASARRVRSDAGSRRLEEVVPANQWRGPARATACRRSRHHAGQEAAGHQPAEEQRHGEHAEPDPGGRGCASARGSPGSPPAVARPAATIETVRRMRQRRLQAEAEIAAGRLAEEPLDAVRLSSERRSPSRSKTESTSIAERRITSDAARASPARARRLLWSSAHALPSVQGRARATAGERQTLV